MKQPENTIVKYILDQASLEEIERLSEWLKTPKNQKLFHEFVKTNYAIDYNMNEYNTEKVKKQLLHKIRRDKNIFYRRRVRSFLKYAAIAILSLGLGFFHQKGFFLEKTNDAIIIKEGSITLELENGMIDVINPESAKEVRDAKGNVIGKQNKGLLTYTGDLDTKTLVYNTLKVPRGKRFGIALSDGTKVYLNSGTSLKYPVEFLPSGKREVFITGEAYFDVAHDAEHPFIVNAEELNVEVMGTEFNVSAYPEDDVTDVVLVEGSVGLYTEGNNLENATKLTPGFKGKLDKVKQSIDTEKVNTTIYTAWRNGELVFRNMSFNSILQKLQRYYNITIINNNETLGGEIFNASFNNESIDKVLSYFNDSYNIDYTVKDNIVYIN